MKNYHMKTRVVIEIFFRSHSSGNCILHHSILSSDECLVLVPADEQESFISFPPASLQAPTPGKPIWSLNAAFLWLTWMAVQRNTCCFSKGWTRTHHWPCHPSIWWSWLSLFSSWFTARTCTMDVSFLFLPAQLYQWQACSLAWLQHCCISRENNPCLKQVPYYSGSKLSL